LIDANRQYVLAEATPKLSISDGPREDGADKLWIGNATIPRCRAICPVVLQLHGASKNPSHTEGEHHKSAVVIDDLLEHEQYSQEWFVHYGPRIRFYAGVPLISADGSIIGALSIFDDIPRPGLGRAEVKIMQDLAETTVRHLESITYRQELNRGERMIRGLASFIQGAEVLLPGQTSSAQNGNDLQSTDIADVNQPGLTITHAQASAWHESNPTTSPEGNRETEKEVVDAALPSEPQKSSPNPQEKLLSAGAKTMFGRAANIIRKTSDLDGIVIFDASIIASKIRTNLPGKSQMFAREHIARPYGSESDSSEITTSHSASPRTSQLFDNRQDWSHSTIKTRRKPCHVLGSAERQTATVLGSGTRSGNNSLTEMDLMGILELYPNGGVIHFDASGNASSTEDSDSAVTRAHIDSKSPAISRTKKKRSIGEAIQAVAPNCRGAFLFPLWNYERGRWFALCLGWSMDSHRTFSPGVDLVYLNAFGNSIMTELSRLDAVATSQAKTTFVQNISHELRSPLHGILGGAQFLQDTSLNVFQANMLSSIEMSGRTLLDTIDHVLDYSKINDLTKSRHPSGANLRSSVRKRISRRRRKRQHGMLDSNAPAIDIATRTEEVVESVFAGASFRAMTSRLDEFNSKDRMTPETPDGSESSMEESLNDRKHVKILLDIPRRASWMFSVQAGAWNRIVMNIFGNSLKFTNSGSVRISLDTEDIANTATNQYVHESEDSEAAWSSSADSVSVQEKKLILTITDTGIGMSNEYLSNHLFTPFSQENSFFTGTGLGMSIVQQLVRSIGGSIAVRSKQHVGTEMKIELPLVASRNSPSAAGMDLNSTSTVAETMNGKKVCVLEPTNPTASSAAYLAPAGLGLGPLLVKTITDWFGAEVSLVNQVEDIVAEVVIFTEPNFESLAALRSAKCPGAKVPIVVFIALDVIEASALRNDARVLSDHSAVEIVTQP
jgi:signal transduction histidine kinase